MKACSCDTYCHLSFLNIVILFISFLLFSCSPFLFPWFSGFTATMKQQCCLLRVKRILIVPAYWCEPPGRLYRGYGDNAMVTMILTCRHISGSHEACYVHISSPAEGRHGSALRGDHWWWHPLLQPCQLGLLLCTTITRYQFW